MGRVIAAIIGVVVVLLGAIWVGQGVGAIQGSFMTGQSQWTYIGSVLIVVGLVLLGWVGYRSSRR